MRIRLKDDKGFSLVELIVVVLIMAIISVALAPQILKWVENSRKSSDIQDKDSLYGMMQITVTNASAVGDLMSNGGAILRIDNSGAKLYKGDGTNEYEASDSFYDCFMENSGGVDLNTLKTRSSGTYILIEIDNQAHIVTAQYRDIDTNNVIELDD